MSFYKKNPFLELLETPASRYTLPSCPTALSSLLIFLSSCSLFPFCFVIFSHFFTFHKCVPTPVLRSWSLVVIVSYHSIILMSFNPLRPVYWKSCIMFLALQSDHQDWLWHNLHLKTWSGSSLPAQRSPPCGWMSIRNMNSVCEIWN